MNFDFYLLLKLTWSRSRNFDIPAPAPAKSSGSGSGSTTLPFRLCNKGISPWSLRGSDRSLGGSF